MNENPGGSPNPLNPNPGTEPESNSNTLDANPSEPVEQVDAQMTGTVPADMDNSVTVEEVSEVEVDPLTQATNGLTGQPVTDPLARPMEQAPPPEVAPPKKKKTGLIIGIIVAVVVLIGGGIAAALVIMNMNRGDAVAKAIEKVVNGNIPSNVAVDGTINLQSNSENSLVSGVEIALDAKASTSSMLNSSVAMVTMTFQEGETASFEFDEIYASNGDLYLKIDGATAALEDYAKLMAVAGSSEVLETDETKCVTDESGETKCAGVEEVEVDCEEGTDCSQTIVQDEGDDMLSAMLEAYAGMLEVVDGEWLRISVDELSQMTNTAGEDDSNTTCLVNFAGNIKNYSNSVAETYNKNPFISSTTKNVTIAPKGNGPVYKVTFDSEKMDGFIGAMKNSSLGQELSSCVGDIDGLAEGVANLPEIYVEVDKDYNFTRLYFTSEVDDAGASLTTDLGFNYPENINVAEPVEYKDFSAVIQEIFMSMYNLPDGTVTAQ